MARLLKRCASVVVEFVGFDSNPHSWSHLFNSMRDPNFFLSSSFIPSVKVLAIVRVF